MSLLTTRQLNAYWTMGWALIKHLLGRPFVGRRRPEPWLARLGDESLAKVPPRAWDLFAATSRCIGCGLCDAVAMPGQTPAQWILSIGRQPSDAPLAQRQAEALERLAPAIDRVCPARVDVTRLALLVRENARMLGGR